jgi:hypothetical protein
LVRDGRGLNESVKQQAKKNRKDMKTDPDSTDSDETSDEDEELEVELRGRAEENLLGLGLEKGKKTWYTKREKERNRGYQTSWKEKEFGQLSVVG